MKFNLFKNNNNCKEDSIEIEVSNNVKKYSCLFHQKNDSCIFFKCFNF